MEFLYPEGKKQALTMSFDDNQDFDRRLVALFDKYGIKGTFNINSSTLGGTAESNCDGNVYVTAEELNDLYKNHEIAVHGLDHKFILGLTDPMIVNEFLQDRKNLESYTGRIINGCAYAFGWHNEHVMTILKQLGIKYSRGVNDTNNFFPPMDFLDWCPTCHQGSENLMALCDTFLDCPGYIELPLMYVWGHSFEFGRSGDWSQIEKFCEKMSGKDFIWYATNMEICNYIQATRSLETSADCKTIYNPTLITIWFKDNGKEYILKPGQTVKLD